ncbi:MAG: hypothetical protein LKF75_03200 [Bacilli bacterium]|jgi:hypothetical protein|nr:hypothetical protein [Bacilli bacterium]MCH4228689.1 hypothetical protein [Bacilli bacterium]MCH4277495.1 hypothetical protein [Bacilli bacterium]
MDEILNYMNIALIVLFVAVWVILLLCFLRGLARGWRYGLYRFVSFAVIFTVALTTLKPLSNALGNWDLTSFGIPEINIAIQNGDSSVNLTASFGTPYSVLSSLIDQFLRAMNVSMSPEGIANYAGALAQSIVLLLLILIEGILIATIVNLLVMLFWHLIWKHLIPKKTRKATYKKGKIWSALSDTLVGLLCMAMIIFPLTSVVNSLSDSWKSVKDSVDGTSIKADKTTADTIDAVVDTYDSSLFSQIFFSWTKNDSTGGKTFDSYLIDYLTKSDYNDTTVSFVQEVSSFAKIGSALVQGGVLSENGINQSSIAYFACTSYAPYILKALSQSSLVTGILPYALSILTNMDQVSSYVKTNAGFDFTTYNYSDFISKFADLYQGLIDSGITGSLFDDDGNLTSTEGLLETAFSGDTVTPMEDLLNALDSDELKLFDDLVSTALYVQACKDTTDGTSADPTKFGISDFLPSVGTDYDEDGDGTPDSVPTSFSDIDWGTQIATLYDTVVQLFSIDSRFFTVLAGGIDSGTFSMDINDLITIIVDNIDKVGEIFYGKDETSSETTSGLKKEASTSTSKCLLDSMFVENALPKALDYLASSLNTSFSLSDENAIDFADVKSTLFNDDMDTQISSVKTEFKSLFTVVSTICKSDDGKAFLTNLEEKPGLYMKDNVFYGASDGLLDALADSLEKLDDSSIASAIMPKVFNSFLSGSDSIFASMNINLTLNFDNIKVGEELSKIVKAFKGCQNIITYVQTLGDTASLTGSALSDVLNTFAAYSDELSTLLNLFVTSKIFNPTASSTYSTNQNLYEVINSLLGSFMSGDYSSTLQSVIENTNFKASDEMDSLVTIIQDLASNSILSKIDEFKNTSSLSVLSDIDFTTLFADINDSSIISSVLGKVLDSLLENSGIFAAGELGSEGNPSFTNVTNWEDEGAGISALIKAAATIGDFSNIDFLNSDPDAITDIISSLSQSQIFTSKDTEGNETYVFSTYIGNKLISYFSGDTMSDTVKEFFSDKGTDSTNYTYETLRTAFASVSKAEWKNTEAANLGDMIYYIQQMGGLDSFSGDLRKLSADSISSLLDTISSSKPFGQVVTYHFYSTLVNVLQSSLTAFSYSNLDYIYSATAAQRNSENTQLSKLLHVVLDPNGVDSSGAYTYALLDSNGNVSSSISIDNADPDYVVTPLLESLADSSVFNTLKVKTTTPTVTYENQTAFEAEVSDLLISSGLYGDSTDESVKSNVRSIVSAVAPDDTSTNDDENSSDTGRFGKWNSEISNLATVLGDVQNMGLDFSSFSLTSLFSVGSANNEANRQNIEGLLIDINASKLLYKAVPLQIKNSISSVSGSGSGLNLTGVNYDYLNGQPYGDDECKTLSYVIMDGTLLQGVDMSSVSSLTDSEINIFSDLIEKMASSNVFNTLAKQDDGTYYSETAFESQISEFLISSELYGDKTSETVKSKVRSIVDSVAPDDPSIKTDDAARFKIWAGGDGTTGEVENIVNVIRDVQNMNLDISAFSFSSLFNTGNAATDESNRQNVENLLNDINSSKVLYRALPTQIKNSLDSIMGSGSGLNITGVNYDYMNGQPYGSDECSLLSYVIMDGCKLENVNISSVASLTDSEIDIFSQLLTKMSSSRVFNTLALKDDGITYYSETAFESQISEFLISSELYGDKTSETVKSKVRSIVDAVAPDDGTITTDDAARFKIWAGGDGATGEVDNIVNVLRDIKSLNLDMSSFSFTSMFSGVDDATANTNRENVASLLKDINASKVLYKAVPVQIKNSLDSVTGSGSGLNLTGINYDYRNGLPYEDSECDTLSYVIMDGCRLQNVNTSSVSSLTDSEIDIFSEMLTKMSSSRIFNTLALKDDGITYYSETAFESQISEFLISSELYGSKLDTSVTSNVRSIVDAVAPDDSSVTTDDAARFKIWAGGDGTTGEVENIVNVLRDIKSMNLDISSFSFTSMFAGVDAATANTNRENVENLLVHINTSKVLYKAIPVQMKGAVEATNVGTSGFTLSGANYDYKNGQPYGDDECNTLSYILMDSASISSINASDIASLSDSSISTLTDLLSYMAKSHIFNSTSSGSGSTVFQSNLATILTTDTLGDIYYSSISPKDTYFTNLNSASGTSGLYYSDKSSKSAYYSSYYFPSIGVNSSASSYDVSLINGDNGSIKSVLTLLRDNSTALSSFSSGGTSSINETTLVSVLEGLNDCELFTDCVPNLIGKFTSSSDISFGSVNFSRSNAFYCYWFKGGSMLLPASQTDANATYNISYTGNDGKYSNDEIELLSSIIKSLNSNQTLLGSLSSSGIANTTEGATQLTSLRSLFTSLSESYVFNLAGAYQGNSSTNSALGVPDDLTLFEQTMFTIYHDSELSSRAYNSNYDSQSSSDAKLYYYIKGFSDSSIVLSTSHEGDWLTEINNLVCDETCSSNKGLLNILRENDLLSGGLNLSSSSMNVSTFGTSLLNSFMSSLNSIDVVNDAVPYTMSSFIEETLGFRTYSEYTSSVTAIGATSFDSSSIGTGGGRYDKLVVTLARALNSGESLTLNYSLNGTDHTEFAYTGSSGENYTFDFVGSSLAPVSFTLTSSVSISSLKYSIDTADYYDLSQAQLADTTDALGNVTNSGFITKMTELAACLTKDSVYGSGDSGYIDFTSPTDVGAFMTGSNSLAPLLNFLNYSGGAYLVNTYTLNGEELNTGTASSNDFTSRDVAFTNLLTFDYTAAGSTTTVSLSKYLAKATIAADYELSYSSAAEYKGSKAIFDDASYSSDSEATWITSGITKVAAVEAGYLSSANSTNFQYTYSGTTVSLKKIHCELSVFSSSTDTINTFASLGSNLTTHPSLLGNRLVAGVYDRLIYSMMNYIQSGSYQNELVAVATSSASTNRSSYSAYSTYLSTYKSFYDESSNIVSFASEIPSLLNVVNKMGFVAKFGGSYDASAAKTAFQGLSNDSSYARLFYLGAYYDYFINYSYYHGDVVSYGIVVSPEVDYPNSFNLTSFPATNTFANAYATIA